MNNIFNLGMFFSFIHFLLCYGVLITLIVSNNINVLIVIFFVIIYVKLLFITYDRCILSIVENHRENIVDNIVNITFRVLTNDYYNFGLNSKKIETIFINLGLLIVINKLIILYFLKYNNIIFHKININ